MTFLTFLPKKSFAFTYPCPRKLREIVKLTLFERETKDKCIDLWMQYHSAKTENVVYALSNKEFKTF